MLSVLGLMRKTTYVTAAEQRDKDVVEPISSEQGNSTYDKTPITAALLQHINTLM